jgi:SAM-dependent methyltransferase
MAEHETSDPPPDRQQDHWDQTYASRPDFLGAEPSAPARDALARFRADGLAELLELGPGQGRDTLLFASGGMNVTALDYADAGLRQLTEKAAAAGLAASVITRAGDVRQPLPFADGQFDACYSHMLLSMALTTPELEALMAEVHRVVRPEGLVVYTVRTTADAHYRQGVDHGDERFETGGFVVHFFDRALVDRLAWGFILLDVADYEEGKLPRLLFGVTMRRI